MNNNISVIILNCKSIRSKLGEIKLLAYTVKPDIMCLSETWLGDSQFNPKFINYNCIFRNRNQHGGGIGIIIKRNIKYQEINLKPFKNGKLEIQAIKVYTNAKEMIITNLYNPNEDITEQEFEHYIQQIGEKFIMVGDYNAHTPMLDQKCKRANKTGKTLEKIIEQERVCLINPVNFYTYLDSRTGKLSCLDLCLTSANLAHATKIEHSEDVGSDHRAVKVEIEVIPVKVLINNRKKWIVTRETIENYANNMEKSSLVKPCTVEEMAEDIEQRILTAAENNIKQTTGTGRIQKSTCWWNAECQIAVKKRRAARRKAELHPTAGNIQEYKRKTSIAKQICKSSKEKSWQNYIQEITYNTPISNVWKKFKSVKAAYEPQSYPIEENNQLVLDNKDKANKFAEQFIKNGEIGKHAANIKIRQSNDKDEEDYNLDIRMEELERALKVKKNTTPGIDNIPYNLISSLKEEQKEEILEIMNTSWGTGKVPRKWKIGIIIPIHKPKKDKTKIDSYRPIMLLPCIGKVLEKIVKERLEYYIEKRRHILQPYQCGFRKGQGTMDALIRFENNIRENFKRGETCIAIYIDLKSAYDKVWRDGLIYKIQRAGVVGKMYKWLLDYLKDRLFRVQVEGELSDLFEMKTGVPQGAILSPLLFNLMLVDLPEQQDIKLHVYADDITITCSKKNMKAAKIVMQQYIKKLEKWCEIWGIVINPDKTKMQYFSLKSEKSPIIRISNKVIEYKKSQKLLGIVFDSPRLRFKGHVDYIVENCTKRINILKALSSTYWGACVKHLRNFYITYIRSKILYGIEIYGAAGENIMERLEKLQNASMRLILGARRTSPIISLQAESAIEPIKIKAKYCAAKTLIKLLNRPPNDETAKMMSIDNIKDTDYFPINSFVRRAKEFLKMINYKNLRRIKEEIYELPPWEHIEKYIISEDKKLNSNNEFLEYLDINFKDYKTLYTDGSKISNTDTSVASGLYDSGKKIAIAWKLSPKQSVLGSELYAIHQALLYIKENKYMENYMIFSDSKSALQLIQANNRNYTLRIGMIQKLIIELNQNREVKLHWVRGHTGIFGNEIADRTANLGHQQNKSYLTTISREEQLNELRYLNKVCWEQYWKDEVNVTQKGKFLREIMETINQQQIIKFKERRMEIVFHRLRIGHVGLKQYMYRFNMSTEEECSECKTVESVEHYLLKCKKYNREREILKRELDKEGVTDTNIKILLGGGNYNRRKNLKILDITKKYVKATNRIDEL